MNIFGNLGPVGLAVVLTVLLLVGIPGGGKLKPLGWWPTLILSMLAGSAYKAAGGIFKLVPDLVGSVISTINGVIPGVTMPALALATAIFILFKKLTTKQVGILGIFFWYIAAGAGGTWSYVSDAIAHLGANVA
ncbi:hypothetical protein ACFZB5_13645 [Streptomyces nodosus]|uniref:hypothetical protein n=1 Tax=Streptomyces nodosus TaxID=40318 RepID=UPI0036EB28A7